MDECDILKDNITTIASELFRFQRVFEKAISKLDINEQTKYKSQFAWFSKKVYKALENSNLRVVSVEGMEYDPGMAVTPLNIDDFNSSDKLIVIQMIEPIIMRDNLVYKTGTVILGEG